MKPLLTEHLELIPQTRDEMLARIEAMPPDIRRQVSTEYLSLLEASAPVDPWIHGFVIKRHGKDAPIGTCGFKGPPDTSGAVEIAYAVDAEQRGRGYATEAAAALTNYAIAGGAVRLVRAHTLPERNASTRVLTKCGFVKVGAVEDPDDGHVWRWECTPVLLFSYGTLQQENVQLATFKRLLKGAADALVGYEQSMYAIEDPEVIRTSGKTHHPIVKYTGDAAARVAGTVFEISPHELTQADSYEVSAYKRVAAPLASGNTAWVYVDARFAPG